MDAFYLLKHPCCSDGTVYHRASAQGPVGHRSLSCHNVAKRSTDGTHESRGGGGICFQDAKNALVNEVYFPISLPQQYGMLERVECCAFFTWHGFDTVCLEYMFSL